MTDNDDQSAGAYYLIAVSDELGDLPFYRLVTERKETAEQVARGIEQEWEWALRVEVIPQAAIMPAQELRLRASVLSVRALCLGDVDVEPPPLEWRDTAAELWRFAESLEEATVENRLDEHGDEEVEKAWAEMGRQVNPAPGEHEQSSHGDDFSWVVWYGVKYQFTNDQAAIVKLLWEQWEKSGRRGGCGLGVNAIAVKINAPDGFRLPATFRKNPALGSMIQSVGKGQYALCPPEKNHM